MNNLYKEIMSLKEKGFRIIKIILPMYVKEELKRSMVNKMKTKENPSSMMYFTGIQCLVDPCANKIKYIVEAED